MGRQRPAAVTNALRAQWALVGVGALGTLLTVLQRDEVLRAWIEANPNARAYFEQGGMAALEASSISIPAFVPVAVVTFVVYAALAWVLGVMFGHGHRWARWSLLTLAAGLLFAAVVVVRAAPPTSFVAVAVVVVLIDLALGWLLLRRECGEWVRAVELAEEREHAG
jgi:hypothetical protein